MEIKLDNWEFDHWSMKHWDEIREGKIDKTRSWVELSEVENPQDGDYELSLFIDKTKVMNILTYRDQWGTWITFKIGDSAVTIAQEDGTKSFMDALISGLNGLKPITDIGTIPPNKINN